MKDLIIAIYVAECKHKKKLITQDAEFCPLCAGEKGVSFGWMKVSLAGTLKVFVGNDGQLCVKPMIRVVEEDV